MLKSNDKNLFLSPFSISTCLAMVYIGAKSTTAEQIASALNFEGQAKLDASFKRIIKDITASIRSQYFDIRIANALWMQKEYNILSRYLGIIENFYFGELHIMDFKTNPEAARITINKWVEEKTENKIKDLIKPEMIKPLTRLILTNAIYFFSSWEQQFRKYNTKEHPFTLINGEKVNVPLMHQKEHFIYNETPNYQAIELPYKRNELSMVIFLPKQIDGLEGMEDSMKAKDFTGWITPRWIQEIDLYLPKFKITSEFRLPEMLKEMGMIDAFNPEKADFSGIAPIIPGQNLFISDVIHKTYIDVNEEGTEAAAATAVIATLGAALEEPRPVPVFKVDHPFMFLIRDVRTNSILFIGRIMDPR